MTNRLQPIFDIAALCAKKNLTHAILCPGSRNAPLIAAFTRHAAITCRTISDERSAGFIALGIAQQTKVATVLVCTSGSAAYNFSPAVAEAFFSQTPLIVLTADRPAEWIAQLDGQTIHQHDIYGQHVKGAFTLPQEYDHVDIKWGINRVINEAINLSMQDPPGPVHINIPLREPLYLPEGDSLQYSEDIRVMEVHSAFAEWTEEMKSVVLSQWVSFRNIFVVAGQQAGNESRHESLSRMARHHHLPVAVDILSNLNAVPNSVSHADLFLGGATKAVKKSLQPDLLITFGNSLISKNLKIFLREFPARVHWHIQSSGTVADPYKTITNIFSIEPAVFFDLIARIPRTEDFDTQKQHNYTNLWEVEERRVLRILSEFFPQKDLAELELVNELMNSLPPASNLHLANSMSVRYANCANLQIAFKDIDVYANRGTSGIDGCTSTAVGHAMINPNPNILITGDMAFFYDRNAFWHNYAVPNLRVVVLNNHGGIIFKIIDGPAGMPEADEYQITNQKLNAKKLCEEYDFEYLKLDTKRKMKNIIKDFMEPGEKIKVLELESSLDLNKTIFEDLKSKIKKSYE